MEIKIDPEIFKRISNSLKLFVESAERTIKELNRLCGIMEKSGMVKTPIETEDKSIKEYMTFISLLNLLSTGEKLPKKIRYNDVMYTNVTKTDMNLLYYNDENNLNFKTELLAKRISGETDIDILNKTIEVIEW